MDRRIVLVVIMAIAVLIDLFFIVTIPTSPVIILSAISLFGALIYSAYPVIVAHASDHAEPGSFIKISGGLLLMYGIGGVVGPLLAGAIMSSLPQQGMFIVTLVSHFLIVAYGILRITQNLAVSEEKKSDFVGMAPGPLSDAGNFSARSTQSSFRRTGHGQPV